MDDPYSHLTVQKLNQLRDRYDIKFHYHLVSQPTADFQGSADHFDQWALRDAMAIAPDFDTSFQPSTAGATRSMLAQANTALAASLDDDDFADTAFKIGTAFWAQETIETDVSTAAGHAAIEQGNQLRATLGHYQGAMFYFEGEWFWGIDRIRSLEERLQSEGFDRAPGPACVPEPTPLAFDGVDCSEVTLEYFPSLRSPYTAVGHARVLDLIERSGVNLVVRPVMPMMMRGIPAPRPKQRYIITDSAREGRTYGAPFGKVVDPFGDPVRQAFALFPACQEAGRALEFVTAYLNAAWFDGVDITTEKGLKKVIANAGLDWDSVSTSAANANWEEVLNENLGLLNQENLWGVPSFRVLGGNQSEPFACWGQDRIWRVANEIVRRSRAE